jgi:hypothetical protein
MLFDPSLREESHLINVLNIRLLGAIRLFVRAGSRVPGELGGQGCWGACGLGRRRGRGWRDVPRARRRIRRVGSFPAGSTGLVSSGWGSKMGWFVNSAIGPRDGQPSCRPLPPFPRLVQDLCRASGVPSAGMEICPSAVTLDRAIRILHTRAWRKGRAAPAVSPGVTVDTCNVEPF